MTELRPFNRERFLFYLLGAVLAVNALFFGYGIILCSRSKNPVATCPELGNRFDSYSEKALAAVLGLIAGAGAITLSQKKPDPPRSNSPGTASGTTPARTK